MIMLVTCIVFIVNTRFWIINRDRETMKRFDEITQMVKDNNKVLMAHANSMINNIDKLTT